jgi:hypothetical protein
MSSRGTLADLAAGIGKALSALRPAIASDADFRALASSLGWSAAAIPPPVASLAAPLATLRGALDAVLAGNPTVGQLDALQLSARQTVDAIFALQGAAFDPSLSADGFANVFPRQLVDRLLHDFLARQHSTALGILSCLGVVRTGFAPKAGNRPPRFDLAIAWGDLVPSLTSPGAVLKTAFGWGTPGFDVRKLLASVQDLAFSINIPAALEPMDPHAAAQISGLAFDPTARIARAIALPVLDRVEGGVAFHAGLRLVPILPNGARLPGLAILPYASAPLAERVKLDDTLDLELHASLDLGSGVGILIRPGEPIATLAGLGGTAPAPANGTITARLDFHNPERQPVVLIGARDGPRVQVQSVSGVMGLYLDPQGRSELYAECELNEGRLIVPPVDDGFLGKILPGSGIDVRFDLAAGLSTLRGLYFRGSGALEITVPAHLSLGPIELQSVTLALSPDASGELPVSVGASFDTSLGPLQATVQNMGLRGTLRFPGSGGNLGPVDVDLGFKWPEGVGLELDAGGFKGGGFLLFDPDHGRYAGILHLEFLDIVSVTAIGLLDTRMPNGEKGFALLIILTAEFNPPFQLSFGFTLVGVGGLVGVNRTMVVSVIQEGVRSGAIDSILFPRDPIANAPRIISDLQHAFPPAEGQFLIGPMFKLGWGTPTLISLSLGVLIELPDPIRITILGILRVALPAEDLPLLELQVNFAGGYADDMIWFDASLYQSHIVVFTLTGDMSLRIVFGDNANFVLTVGGFHPAYTPPPLSLPNLARLGFSIADLPIPRIRCETYFALTANTVQHGSHLEVFAGVDDFNIHGFFGYDLLIRFNPFHLTAAVSGTLAVTLFGDDVCGVWVEATVDGPSPWEVDGRGRFKVFVVSFTVHIHLTVGDPQSEPQLQIDVVKLLTDALAARDNWRADLPANTGMRVRTKDLPADTPGVIVHPFGSLVVSQKSAPLDISIEKVGNAVPTGGPVTLKITKISTVSGELGRTGVRDQFAPGQFQNLSDADRLSRPSFEQMTSGARIDGASLFDARYLLHRLVEYERIIIDRKGTRRPLSRYLMAFDHFTQLVAGSAVSQCAVAANVDQKPREARVRVEGEAFTVVWAKDLTPAHAAATKPTQAEAVSHLGKLVEKNPALAEALLIVPAGEVQAA